MTSLEEGSPQGWGVLVVLAELPPAAPSNPSRSAPCRTRVAREDHDGPSSPGRCLPVRSSPSAAPLLAISRVSGVVWLVVVVIAPLAAPGHHPLPTQNVAFADWMTDHAILRVNPIPASNHSTSPPVVRPDSSVRRTARIVGVLFLAGYLAYGVGSLIATGIVRSADRSGSTALFVTGAALMLLNSAFVIGIGVLMFPILRAHNKAIAAGYLGTRIFEGVGLAIGVVSLIVGTGSPAIHANTVSYNVAEAGLGIGSLFFCALLFRTGLVPRFLAVWGFIGYACFAGGTLLELFGVAGAGLVGAIPGGLFELTFGIWLIARGFASTATVRSRAST